MKIAFLQDFFESEIIGGAEQNDSVLLNFLNAQENLTVVPVHTYMVHSVIECYDFFVVSNFVRLPEQVKQYLINKKNYIIYEHDHKYVKTRNPASFARFKIPEHEIINRSFYENAKKVFVLSEVCKEILEDSLQLNNVHNIGCSLWSEEKRNTLRQINQSVDKNPDLKFAVLQSNNQVKGTQQALDFCQQKNIRPHYVGSPDYKTFMRQLAESEHLIFFPQVLETYSRLVVEAKILNCKIVTMPKMVGFFSEDYSELSGLKLLEKVTQQIDDALVEFKKVILS